MLGHLQLCRLGMVYGTTASAPISTSSAGSISWLIWTMEVAGRIFAKTSPCARPTASQRLMSVSVKRALARRLYRRIETAIRLHDAPADA